MVINKMGSALTSRLSIKGFSAADRAQVWRYSAADLGHIVRGANATVANAAVSATYPANSITLLVIPRR